MRSIVLVSLLVLSLVPAAGAIVAPAAVSTLVAEADHVFIGRVTDARSRPDPAGGSILTDVSLAVEEYFKSRAFPARFTLTLPGGTIGETTLRVPGVPALADGDRVVVFLQDRAPAGVAPAGVAIVGGWQGLFNIRGAETVQAESGRMRPLAELAARVRATVRVPPPAYSGAAMTARSVEGLARHARHIVVASVEDVRAQLTDTRESIETQVTLRLERSLKGGPPARTVLWLPGGAVGDVQVLAGGVPHFWPGERVLVFLEPTRSGRLAIAGLWQGKYSLVNGHAVQPETGHGVPLGTLEARIARALADPSGPSTADDAPTVSVAAPFTTFCLPWTPAQTPVAHWVNGAGPGVGGPDPTEFLRLVQQALQVWQEVPAAWYAARVAGTTTRPATDHLDGNNDVAWGSLDSFGSGVLGVNFCTLSSGQRLDSDTQIDNTGRGWSTTAAPGLFDLDSVLRHELGHSAGLGHRYIDCDGGPTPAIMCPSLSPGVEKTLQADDIEGLVSLYPLTGAPPAPPVGVTARPAGEASATIAWADVAGELAYEVQRSQVGCLPPFVAVATVPADVTGFVDDDLGAGLPGGVLCYRIKALGLGGDSPESDLATVEIQGYFRGGVFVAVGALDGPGTAAIVTGAGTGGGPRVRAFDLDGTPRGTSFYAYAREFRGGVRVAACDFDGDGRAEIVTAPGGGGGPHVRVWKLGAEGDPVGELASFYAYEADFSGGLFVACGDVDGDGVPDIVTGADVGGGPHVRAFRLDPRGPGGVTPIASFFAFSPDFAGGVRVAVGAPDGDRACIIAAAGPGGGPHVRVFRLGAGGVAEERASFFAYAPSFTGGVYVAAGRLWVDGASGILTGAGPGGGPHVRAFTPAGADAGVSLLAYGSTFQGGVRVATGALDGPAVGEIVTGAGPGGRPHVRAFPTAAALSSTDFFAY